LIGGVARWMKHASPTTKIIGVCAAGAPSMEQSWIRGIVVETATATTIADGIGVRVPIAEAVGDTVTLVDQIARVGDKAMVRAMRQAYDELRLVLEPAGAAGLAALNLHARVLEGQRVGVVLTGANTGSAVDRKPVRPT
jgi:threonine dehydratase